MTSRDLSPETRTPSLRISCLRSSVSSQTKNGACFFFFSRNPPPAPSDERTKKKKKKKPAAGVGVCFGRGAEEPDGAVCAYIVRRKAPDVASCGRPAPGRHKAACCALRRAGLASSTRNCHNSHDEANPPHRLLHLPARSHFGWRDASIHLESSASIKDASDSSAPTLS